MSAPPVVVGPGSIQGTILRLEQELAEARALVLTHGCRAEEAEADLRAAVSIIRDLHRAGAPVGAFLATVKLNRRDPTR